jgi:hypothetical protein
MKAVLAEAYFIPNRHILIRNNHPVPFELRLLVLNNYIGASFFTIKVECKT